MNTPKCSTVEGSGSNNYSASSTNFVSTSNHPDKNPKNPKQDESTKDAQNMFEPPFKIKIFPQLMAAFAALVGAFSFGNALAFSAVAMPKLRQDGNFPLMTEDDISWMSAIVDIGALCACVPTGFAVDKFGRRKMMLFLAVPFLAGWTMIYLAQNMEVLMLGRFLTGFCGGGITLVVPIFIAETSEPRFRGMLINGFELMVVAGSVFISVIGKFYDWRTQAIVCSAVPLQALILLYFIPESPRFLLCTGREKKAFASLCWFRGASHFHKEPVQIEFEMMMRNMTEDKKAQECCGFIEKWREFASPPVFKSFLLILALFFFEEFSGIAALDCYTVDIFESTTIHVDPYLCCILAHVVEMLFSTCCGFLMDRIHRKFLLVFSETIMTISLGFLAIFFYLKEQHPDSAWMETLETSQTFVPIFFVFLFYAGFALGISSVPLLLMPELLPQRVRGVASSLLLTFKWTMSFFVSRYFKNYMSAVGDALGYSTFATICFVGLIFGFFFLPKTNGKSLEQIQIELNDKHRNKNNNKNKLALNSDSQSPV